MLEPMVEPVEFLNHSGAYPQLHRNQLRRPKLRQGHTEEPVHCFVRELQLPGVPAMVGCSHQLSCSKAVAVDFTNQFATPKMRKSLQHWLRIRNFHHFGVDVAAQFPKKNTFGGLQISAGA